MLIQFRSLHKAHKLLTIASNPQNIFRKGFSKLEWCGENLFLVLPEIVSLAKDSEKGPQSIWIRFLALVLACTVITRPEGEESVPSLHLSISTLLDLGGTVRTPEVRARDDSSGAVFLGTFGPGDEAADHGGEKGISRIGPNLIGDLVLF